MSEISSEELLSGPWKELFSHYYINQYAVVMRKKDSKLLCPSPIKKSRRDNGGWYYTLLNSNNVTTGRSATVLVRDIFGSDEHLTTDIFAKIRELTGHEGYKTPKSDRRTSRTVRKCHDCGAPTDNYRCHECWAALRGFEPNSTMERSYSYGFEGGHE